MKNIFTRKTFLCSLLFMASSLCLQCSSPASPSKVEKITLTAKDIKTGLPLCSAAFLVNDDTLICSDSAGRLLFDKEAVPSVFSVASFPYLPQTVTIRNSNDLIQEVYFSLPPKLSSYQEHLLRSLQMGYQFLTVEEYVERKESGLPNRFIVMRHDVDFLPVTASAFAVIEKNLSICSTYYFRWSTADQLIVRFIKSLGHEIGLHFETIASYAKENNLTFEQASSLETIEKCRALLKEEIKRFEVLFGDIQTVSSHGDTWNIQNRFSNSHLLRNQDLSLYSIKANASSLEGIIRLFDLFIADSGDRWVPVNYDEALNSNHARLYILIHPDWWKDNVRYSHKRTSFDYYMVLYYYDSLRLMLSRN